MNPNDIPPTSSDQPTKGELGEQPGKKTVSKRAASRAVDAKTRKRRRRVAAVEAQETEKTQPAKTPRRRTIRKASLKFPPILLEGDVPVAGVAKLTTKTAEPEPVRPLMGIPAPVEDGVSVIVEGTKELILVARDPRTLYAHWDLSPKQQREYIALAADGNLMLRIYLGSLDGSLVSQVKLPAGAYHCFVGVPVGGARYQAELGYTDTSGRWTRISASGIVATPSEESVSTEPIKFATVSLEPPRQEEDVTSKKAGLGHVASVEPVEKRVAIGVIEPPVPGVRVHESQAVQAEIPGRITRGKLELVGQFGSEAALQHLGEQGARGISSPGGEEKKRRGFWFNVNVELVIYGATEPDAQVSLGGLPIKLRADGTFSCRIALPDGQHELGVEAVSADRKEQRTAKLNFMRLTKYTVTSAAYPTE